VCIAAESTSGLPPSKHSVKLRFHRPQALVQKRRQRNLYQIHAFGVASLVFAKEVLSDSSLENKNVRYPMLNKPT